jgi:tetratricopeptide (TPR) repeat protein
MPQSAFSRFWNTVNPPPSSNRPGPPPPSAKVLEMKRRQRRLITITLVGIAAIGAGAWTYNYIASAPERADQEYLEGMKSMSPGKYPDAVAHFTKAISIYNQLPNAYLERGNANRVLGEMDAALADYQAAADLNPVLPEAHSGIAVIYIERHDTARALEHLNKSISLHPTVEAFYQRGQILEAQGQHEKAIADYDRAIAEENDAPYMYRARALAKANMGDAEGAHTDREIAGRIERPRALPVVPAPTGQ